MRGKKGKNNNNNTNTIWIVGISAIAGACVILILYYINAVLIPNEIGDGSNGLKRNNARNGYNNNLDDVNLVVDRNMKTEFVFFTTLGPIPNEEGQKRDLIYALLACWNWLARTTRFDKRVMVDFVIFSEDDKTREEIKSKFKNLQSTDDFTPNLNPFNVPIKSLYAHIFKEYPHSPVTVYFNGDILFDRNTIEGVIFAWEHHHSQNPQPKAGNTFDPQKRGFCASSHRKQTATQQWLSNALKQYGKNPWEWTPNQVENVVSSAKDYVRGGFYSGYDFFACSYNIWDWNTYFPNYHIPLMCSDNNWIDDCRLNGEYYRLENMGGMYHMSFGGRKGDKDNPVLGQNCDIYSEWGKKNEKTFPRKTGIVNWVNWKDGHLTISKEPYGLGG